MCDNYVIVFLKLKKNISWLSDLKYIDNNT